MEMAALVIKNPSGVMTSYSGLSLRYVRGRLLIQCSNSVRRVISSTSVTECSPSVFSNPFFTDCISRPHQPSTHRALGVMNFHVCLQKSSLLDK